MWLNELRIWLRDGTSATRLQPENLVDSHEFLIANDVSMPFVETLMLPSDASFGSTTTPKLSASGMIEFIAVSDFAVGGIQN